MTERQAAATFLGQPLTLIGDELRPGDMVPDFNVLAGGRRSTPYSRDDGKGNVRIFNVVVSIDTRVCEAQTRRFLDEAAGLEGVEVLTVSADLPFAQGRWAHAAQVDDRITMLSDHRDLSFGRAFGIAVKETRLLGRGVFVVDPANRVVHAEYVDDLSHEPDYDAALAAARRAAGPSSSG